MYNFICLFSLNDNLLLLLFLVYNTVICLVSLLYANKDIHKQTTIDIIMTLKLRPSANYSLAVNCYISGH